MLKYKGSCMKNFTIIILIVIAIISTIVYVLFNYNTISNRAQRKNLEYESYCNKEITGADVASLMNKAIDNNEANNVEKDEKGNYKDNGKNSINIDIKFIDNDETYRMETFYKNGVDTFVEYYNSIKFKCTNIKYHEGTKQVSYMYIEQTSI